jgi:formylmethanofuran dehydrogenase subunit E-like metal-binding protein
LAVCVVCLVGCNGGAVDRHALTNDSATIDSIACEGALLAHNAGAGRTTANFAREQAEELQIQASNLADALATRPTSSSLERRVRAKAAEAARLSRILARLRRDPSNKALAAVVASRLSRLGGCA